MGNIQTDPVVWAGLRGGKLQQSQGNSQEPGVNTANGGELPILAELVARKLHLRWEWLLEVRHLTGQHLGWADPGSSSPHDRRGLNGSISLARDRFKHLANEYWPLWTSATSGYEQFRHWIWKIEAQVLDELKSVWSGPPEARILYEGKPIELKNWFERICKPAVEATLKSRSSEWIVKARNHELEVTEFYLQKGYTRNSVLENHASEPEKVLVDWSAIEIVFLSEERVQITNGSKTETLNYGELGFEDGRNGKPTLAWSMLQELAAGRGTIRDSRGAGVEWAKVEKRIEEIREGLREYFKGSGDPIPFVEGSGYVARFQICCGPSYKT